VRKHLSPRPTRKERIVNTPSGVSPIVAESGVQTQPPRRTEPFAAIPHWVHDPDTGLKDRAIRLYLALARRADRAGKAVVSHATLAGLTGKSEDTVSRCVEELEKAGAIIVVRTKGEAGIKNLRNVYFLVDRPPAP
jgi:biotin operon repressor